MGTINKCRTRNPFVAAAYQGRVAVVISNHRHSNDNAAALVMTISASFHSSTCLLPPIETDDRMKIFMRFSIDTLVTDGRSACFTTQFEFGHGPPRGPRPFPPFPPDRFRHIISEGKILF